MSEPGKRAAGRAAAQLIEDGMTVGLGTGSTASCFIEALAERLNHENLRIRGVPTSLAAERLARKHGILSSRFRKVPVRISPSMALTKRMHGLT
jgi:ribose 5-phosphate isomerase